MVSPTYPVLVGRTRHTDNFRLEGMVWNEIDARLDTVGTRPSITFGNPIGRQPAIVRNAMNAILRNETALGLPSIPGSSL